MKQTQRAVVQETLALMRPLLVLKQIGLALATMLLATVWLRLPDSSSLWLFLTAVLGLLIITFACGGEASLLLSLAQRPRTRGRLVLGILMVLAAMVLWLLIGTIISHLSANDWQRAGYLNSRFGQRQRYVFSYLHIHQWLGWVWSTLQMLLDGIATALCLAPIAAIRTTTAIRRTLSSSTYWIVAAIAFLAAPWLTNAFAVWVPGHGLPAEMTSLILRMIAIVLIDGIVAGLLLAVIAACVKLSNVTYNDRMPAGTPLDSHPRTADKP